MISLWAAVQMRPPASLRISLTTLGVTNSDATTMSVSRSRSSESKTSTILPARRSFNASSTVSFIFSHSIGTNRWYDIIRCRNYKGNGSEFSNRTSDSQNPELTSPEERPKRLIVRGNESGPMVEKLDNLQGYSGWDRSDMLSQIEGFVNHVKEAIGYQVQPFAGVSSICLWDRRIGYGGDACWTIWALICYRNISVVRNVSLPKWVNDGTLVIVISYSGNTKEALDIFQDSFSKGTQDSMRLLRRGADTEGKGKERPIHPGAIWYTAQGGLGLSSGIGGGYIGIGRRLRFGRCL